MSKMSKSNINTAVENIINRRDELPVDSRKKAVSVLERLPLSLEQAKMVIASEDIDFAPIGEYKRNQRFEDMALALGDAIDDGVESIDEFISWIGMPADSNINDVIDTAHAYIRLGERHRPETISMYFK